MRTSSSERLAQTLEKARRQWKTRSSEAPTPQKELSAPASFTVTISRQQGIDAGAVANALGQRLDWPIYDRELLEHIAGELGLRTSLVESVDERRVGWLAECMNQLTSTPSLAANKYFRQLAETVLSLGSHGRCIVVGRGAEYILSPERTLRVRLVAPFPHRVAESVQSLSVSENEARRQVKEVDQQRRQFIHDHFHKASEPEDYDLVLNTSRFSYEECADVISESLRCFVCKCL